MTKWRHNEPTNCLNERFGCFYLPPIGNRLVSLGCLEQVSLEKNRKYEVEGRAMRKEALTPTPPKEKLSSHATRGIVTVRWKYVADLAG